MTSGLAYDSDEARGLCGVITALLHGAACLASTELAAAVGPFDEYENNREPMMHVMEMHWEKVDEIKGCAGYLQEAARDLWDKVLAHGRRHGFRNAQATVLAPTGTISFMMDCDTTGIEPDIALVKYKQLAGGGTLKMVNQKVPLALKHPGLQPGPDRRRSWPTSTSTTRSRGRRTSRPSTCRCSIAPSRRATGGVRSPGGRTSG